MFNPFIIFAFSLIGVAGIQPYVLRVVTSITKSVSKPIILIASTIQGIFLMAISSFLGAYFSNMVGIKSGIDYPLSFSWLFGILLGAVIPGCLVGILLVALDKTFFSNTRKLIPSFMEFRKSEIIFSAFYGGISEEILTRFFVFSAIYYYLSQLGITILISLPLSIIASSLIFAAGHLPNVIAFIGRSRLVVLRALILNTLGGIVFGLIFFYLGLLYSIVSHFVADLVINYPYSSRQRNDMRKKP